MTTTEYTITAEQAEALEKAIDFRDELPISIQELIGEPETIMVQFAHIWLGIEPDGYTHS